MSSEISAHDHEQRNREGVLYAFGAYFLWGLFPVYWKWLRHVPALEILAHRVFWSFTFYWFFVAWTNRKKAFIWFDVLKDRSLRYRVALASVLLTANWLLYIWAVNNGHILESSLGYFITPLLNVLMGSFILKEKLSRLKWISVGLAAIGVITMGIQSGQLPWISIALAVTFSVYGLIRKRINVNVFQTSTAETSLMVIPALVVILTMRSSSSAIALSAVDYLLLILSGIVTGLPLIWFAHAAQRLPLSTLGFFQYIAPTLQFALGVLVYKEPFSAAKLFAFAFIWAALAVFSWETVNRSRSSRRA